MLSDYDLQMLNDDDLVRKIAAIVKERAKAVGIHTALVDVGHALNLAARSMGQREQTYVLSDAQPYPQPWEPR